MNQTRTKNFGGWVIIFLIITMTATVLCGCNQPTNPAGGTATGTSTTGGTSTNTSSGAITSNYVEQELTNTSWSGSYITTGTVTSSTYGEGARTSRYTECYKFNLDGTYEFTTQENEEVKYTAKTKTENSIVTQKGTYIKKRRYV